MRLWITGATGTAGKAALQAALRDARVASVLATTRRALPFTHSKLTTVEWKDFGDYTAMQPQLADVDACLWCLGISTSQVSGAAEYERITYDYAMAAAKSLGAANPKAAFLFLSGQGADSSERSMILFARVKGRTENALVKLGQPRTVIFRPGGIHGPDPPAALGNRIVRVFAPALFWLVPGSIIHADDLGRAMVEVALTGGGVDKTILENNDIRAVADRCSVPPPPTAAPSAPSAT